MNEYKKTENNDYPVVSSFKPKIGDPFCAPKLTSEDFNSIKLPTESKIPILNREKEFEIIFTESEIKRLIDVLCVNGEAYKDIVDKLRNGQKYRGAVYP